MSFLNGCFFTHEFNNKPLQNQIKVSGWYQESLYWRNITYQLKKGQITKGGIIPQISNKVRLLLGPI